MIHKSVKYCAYIIFGFVSLLSFAADDKLTYKSLVKDGIVSGFGKRSGHPLYFVNAIRPISRPKYVRVKRHLYKQKELCIGSLTSNGWRFVPIAVLNSREIVNHRWENSLCFCPLAGLAISVPGVMGVSGLLKYDTFVLHADATGDLILPYTQKVYKKNQVISFQPVHLLTYGGIVANFPDALVLDSVYPLRNPYGNYSTSPRQGVGHATPGLRPKYKSSKFGLHPKERVLIIGFGGRLQSAFPFSEILKTVGKKGGEFVYELNGRKVYIHYAPQYQWATAKDEFGNNLNVAYSYMFSLYHNLPDLPVYFF